MAKAAPIYKLTKPDGILRDSVSVILLRLEEMLEFVERGRNPKEQESLHNMRIATKRLRYTLEIFAPTLPSDAIAVLETIETIQEQLGAIHDLDILIPVLQDVHEKEIERERRRVLDKQEVLPHLAAEGLLAQIARYKAERQERFVKFWLYWDTLPPATFTQSLHNLVTPPK
jgi:CHAD domain-containing protein